MKHKQNTQSGFGVVGVILVTVAVLTTFAIGVFAFGRILSSSQGSTQSNNLADDCSQNDQVRMCVEYDKENINWAQGLQIPTTVENFSAEDYTYIYSNGCTDPSLLINGQNAGSGRICTLAMSPVTLKAGETKKLDLSVPYGDLDDGQNTVEISWIGLLGPKISVTKPELSTAEVRKIGDECYGAQTYSIQGCSTLTIMFEDELETYDEVDEILAEYNLKAIRKERASDLTIRVVSASAPAGNTATEIADTLQQNPTINLVTVDF